MVGIIFELLKPIYQNTKSLRLFKTNIYYCMIFRVLTLFLFILFYHPAQSQQISESMAKAELERRGYNAERFKQEMIKRGINPENVDANNAIEVARARKVAEEVMAMLDKEKSTFQTKPIEPIDNEPTSAATTRSVDAEALTSQVGEIQKAVKSGATIEEAVSEKLQENQSSSIPEALTYGQHIFRDKSLRLFRTSEDAKPPKSYIIGPGDKVAVSIWGESNENFAIEVSKDGYIKPTDLPRYYISGLSIASAEELLYSKLRTKYYFSRENYELTVVTARTINVNIVGEVYNHGTFNISAVNTAFNALVAAGGPNEIGSVRKIQLLRPGNKPVTIDVYKYLQNPAVNQSYYLQENDFIHVPVASKVVQISGAINRPYKYELIENEGLVELIAFAGGLKSSALKNNIQIRRIENDSVRIIDINLLSIESKRQNFELKNGDNIFINSIEESVRNEVFIFGAVEKPGKFAIEQGDRISALLSKSILKKNAITSLAYIKRRNDDGKTYRYEYVNLSDIIQNPNSPSNLILKPDDEFYVGDKGSFVDNNFVEIKGAVRTPTKISLDDSGSLKISDMLFFAEGIKEDALTDFAYVYRRDPNLPNSIQYLRVNLLNILKNVNSTDNILLEPEDIIEVFSKSTYSDQKQVYISGAVRYPGEFSYNPTLQLKDLILLAGGLKQEASKERINIYRIEYDGIATTRILAATLRINDDYEILNSGDFYLQPYDQVFVRTAPEFELQRNIKISGEVTYPGEYSLLGKNATLVTMIKEAGGVTEEAFIQGATLRRPKVNNNYVIIDLEKALKSQKSLENIILQEGDEIFIPKISNIVKINGATKANEVYLENITASGSIYIPYKGVKSAMFYVNNYAGGLANNADHKKITVRDANGKISKTKNYLLFKTYPSVKPGSEIVVGFKEKESKKEGNQEKENVKWGEVLANSIAQASAILSLILLIQNVN